MYNSNIDIEHPQIIISIKFTICCLFYEKDKVQGAFINVAVNKISENKIVYH